MLKTSTQTRANTTAKRTRTRDLFHEMNLWKVLWQCGQVIVIVLFPFSCLGKTERNEIKKRPLPMSLFQAPEKALSKTREEVRALTRALSCTCRSTNFLRIRNKRRLAESNRFGLGLLGGVVLRRARRCAARTGRIIAEVRAEGKAKMADVACGATPCDLATGRPDDLGQVGGSASRQVK